MIAILSDGAICLWRPIGRRNFRTGCGSWVAGAGIRLCVASTHDRRRHESDWSSQSPPQSPIILLEKVALQAEVGQRFSRFVAIFARRLNPVAECPNLASPASPSCPLGSATNAGSRRPL